MEALRSILRTRRIHRPRDDGQALSEQPSALTHCSGPPVSVHETLPRREQVLSVTSPMAMITSIIPIT